MRRVLGERTEMKDGQDLRGGVDSPRQAQDLSVAAEPGAQFVQLEMRKLEVAEKVLVEGLSMLPSAGQPGGYRGLTVAEDTFGGGSIQPFGERSQHYCNLLGGSFQAVQGGGAPGSERGVASLTAKRLAPLSTPTAAIPHH